MATGPASAWPTTNSLTSDRNCCYFDFVCYMVVFPLLHSACPRQTRNYMHLNDDSLALMINVMLFYVNVKPDLPVVSLNQYPSHPPHCPPLSYSGSSSFLVTMRKQLGWLHSILHDCGRHKMLGRLK